MKPNNLIDLARAYQPARVLLSAVELGFLETLAAAPASAPAVAAACATSPLASERLLDTLCALGVLHKDGENYRIDDGIRDAFVPGHPACMVGMLRHQAQIWKSWSLLTETVRTGAVQKPDAPRDTPESREQLRDFIAAMANIGVTSAREFVEAAGLEDARRFIDVGGGPGLYAIAAARSHPALEATLFDRPDVLEIAKTHIEKAGLTGRIKTIAGDALADPFGDGYDAILMSNLIHSFSRDEVRAVFAKAFRALAPGGRLFVKEFLIDDAHTGPEFAALFGINMLVNTDAGDVYSEGELKQWLGAAGFGEVTRRDLAVNSALITATRR